MAEITFDDLPAASGGEISFDDLPSAEISFDDLPNAELSFDDLPDAETQTIPSGHPDRITEAQNPKLVPADDPFWKEGDATEILNEFLQPANVNALSPSVVQAESGDPLSHEQVKRDFELAHQSMRVHPELPKPDPTGVGSGITSGLIELGEEQINLENAALITGVARAPAIVQRAVSTGFGVHMIPGAVETILNAPEGETTGEQAKRITKGIAGLLLGVGAIKHGASRAPEGKGSRPPSMSQEQVDAAIAQRDALNEAAARTAAPERTPPAAPAGEAPPAIAERVQSPLPETAKPIAETQTPSAQAAGQTKPVAESPSAEGSSATGQARPAAQNWKQKALPEELRTTPELEEALAAPKVESERAPMREKSFEEGGALGFGGGGKPVVKPVGVTPKGDTAFIRVEGALKRVGRGLFTEGVGDVLAKSKNKIGQLLSKQVRKHVDLEQEITGQLTAELDRATKGMSSKDVQNAITELEPYIAAKENGRPLPAISKNAKSMLTAWENIAERTGLMSEAHDVQVFDPTTGGYRSMHRIGRSYIPRIFRPDVQKVLQDPRSNPKLFNDLANALAAHRGVTLEAAAAELRGVAGRFQASDFMGNMEMARTGQLPEVFYDYNLGNMASRYIPAFSERMAQIVSYGQRLGPRERPLRENLWDVAMKEAEDSYTQQWLRSAEDQAVNLHDASGFGKFARRAQTAASGLLLASPTTTVMRNMLSGTASTAELLGARRASENLIKAATDAQTKLAAREMGVVRENLGDFLHADQLGQTKADDLIRGVVNTTLKYSGYTGSEGFVRTHAAATASQFAKDGVAAIQKNPSSGAAKEALGLFKRMGVDAEKIVAEGADWKTGAETRKFVRTVIRDSQGGYRFDQVPVWLNSPVGRFFFQYLRWGAQRSRNIWKNGFKPLLGEDVQWHGKTMTRRDAGPLIKMGLGAVVLGETYALLSQGFFGRDRKDASLQEISEALSDDEKNAAVLVADRVINDILMSGSLGILTQPVDAAKSLKDQSRLKNPAEPPGMAAPKAALNIAKDTLDQQGRVTKRDLLDWIGGTAPGVKQASDLARNVFDESLYEAENDVRTLRNAGARWAQANKIDVPKRSVTIDSKSPTSPDYEEIRDALLVGDATRAKFLAEKFVSEKRGEMKNVKQSVKSRQPFRIGPFTNDEYKGQFMTWAAKNLPKKDFEQAKRVQDRYEAAAKAASLW